MFNCKYCNKEFEYKCGCNTHERYCRLNPNKLISKSLGVKREYKPKPKKLCDKCNQYISVCNFNCHYQKCNNGIKNNDRFNLKDKYIKINNNQYKCLICGFINNKNSIINHIIYNHTEWGINHLSKIQKMHSGKPSWNKGLTAETDERVRKSINTLKERIKQGLIIYKGHPHTEEFKQKARENALKNNFGGVRKSKKIFYNGYNLGSSFEYKLALNLDKNNIKWIVPSRFKYIDLNGKLRHYTPDFYLPEYDIYLDPKNNYLINNINPKLGYKDSDKIQWVCEQNNIKCYILNEQQLNWNYIKNNIINKADLIQ